MDSEERVPENLKKQLALAIRSIQWSYAIFWSISPTQPGVLEWGDGYYNGDIKTRKTIQAVELNADELGLQRSEQLRELYESLSDTESSCSTTRRPSASLSPEDLADTEWYYLVCMSFVFNTVQGLPGRTLASGRPIWLCHAQNADSKVFSRSLLAKSAGIQTIVCFPFRGGVIEMGVTDLVLDDPSLIQHVKTTFLDAPYPTIMYKPDVVEVENKNDKGFGHNMLEPHVLDEKLIPDEDLRMGSPDKSSNATDSFMLDRLNVGGASQLQSWQFIDEEFSNCIHSSDCISQTLIEPTKVVPFQKGDLENNQSLQDKDQIKAPSLDLMGNDLHYQSVLSTLFKTSHQFDLDPRLANTNKESSFVSWKKAGPFIFQKPRSLIHQRFLKKILFQVPRMHEDCSEEEIGISRPDSDTSHMLSERKRREKLNERFMILRTIIPSINKADKVSILDDTIDYLQELEKKVEELESCRELLDAEARNKKRKQHETAEERTSGSDYRKKLLSNKAKACEVDEAAEHEAEYVLQKDGSNNNLSISMSGKKVEIELKCCWREGILLEIMDEMTQLDLDSHSIQSSSVDGIFTLTINSQYKGLKTVSVGMIQQALQRVTWRK